MRALVVVSLSLLFLGASSAMAQEAGGLSTAWRERLRTGYGVLSLSPRVRGVLAGLKSPDEAKRERSADLLVKLLAQALADDTPEPAPFKRGYGWGLDAWWHIGTPAWGTGTRAAAWRYRLLNAVETGEFGEATIPIVRWAIRNERLRTWPLKSRMIRVMTSSRGAAWDALLVETAVASADTSFAKLAALDAIVKRALPMEPGVVRRLAHGFQPEVRALAHRLAKKLRHPDPGPFDAVAAVKSPAFRALLDAARPFVPYLPPQDATFAVATVVGDRRNDPVVGEGRGRFTRHYRGWLIDEDERSWTMFTARGMRCRWPKEQGPLHVKLKPQSIAAEVAWVRAQRAAFPGDECALEGIRSWGCSLYELILSLWLADRGRDEDVAGVMLPALGMKHVRRDIDLPGLARLLGHCHGEQMMTAFIAERNPARTIRLARELLHYFPFGLYRPIAERLLAEMPRHAPDFDTLTLPTPEAWAARKAACSREEAIRYLAARLRLITSIESVERWSGDDRDRDRHRDRYRSVRQRRRVRGLVPASRAAFDCPKIRWNGEDVINPFFELAGVDDPSDPGSAGMKLAPGDVAVLAPFLIDDFCTRSVTVGSASCIWELIHTRDLVAALIEKAAGGPLVDLEAFDGMSIRAREAEVEQLVAWARTREKRPPR